MLYTEPVMRDKRYIPSEEFNAIYGRVPRLTVEVIVRTPEGIILTERSIEPWIGTWHITGGTVFFGERIHDAVHRVAQEELGVEVEIVQQLGFIEYPELVASGYKGWPVGIAFEAKITSGEPRGSKQGERIGYFTSVPDNIFPHQALFLQSTVFNPKYDLTLNP